MIGWRRLPIAAGRLLPLLPRRAAPSIVRAAVAGALLLIGGPGHGVAVAQPRPAEIVALDREIDRLSRAKQHAAAAVVAERLVALAREGAGEQSLLHAKALARLADIHFEQERYLQAVPSYQKSLELHERLLGSDHADLVRLLGYLAETLVRIDRARDAIPLRERALAIQERRLGPNNPGIVLALTGLADAHSYMTSDPRRMEKIEPLFRRALDIMLRSFGPDDERTLEVTGNLALIYQEAGRYEEAERILDQIIAAHRKRGRERKMLASMEQLAELYTLLGRFDAAVGLREHLLGRLARLEPNSYVHAGMLSHLGGGYLNQGRYDEAIALQERSLDMLQRLRGPDDIELAAPLHNLATAHYYAGRPAEAEKLLRRSIALQTRSRGSESTWVVDSSRILVQAARDQGRFDEARTLAERNLAIEQKLHGLEYPRTGQAIDLLASVYFAQKRYSDAKPLYEKASHMLDKTIGRDHFVTFTAMRDLAATECALGEYDASLEHAREAARFFARRAGRPGAAGEPGARELYAQGAVPTLVCAAFGAAGQRPREREALASEALIAAQQERRTLAEAALAQMAVRVSAGDAALADAVRRRQDLTGRLRALDQQLIGALSKTDGGKGEADRIRAQRAQAERQLGEVVAGIARTNPDFAALTSPQPIDLAAARRHLRDEEAMVAYLVTNDASYIWAISRTALAWERIPLGTAALTEKIAVFRRPLDEWAKAPRGLERLGAESTDCAPAADDPRGLARSDAACTNDRRFSLARAHELYAALLGPVETVIKGKRHLILVPSGPLTGLPFSALITEKPADTSGNSKSFATAPWLVRRHATTVLPSVASLALLRQHAKPSRATRSFVGVGNPDFSGGTPVATGRPGRAGARTAANAPAIPPVQVAEARGFSGYFRGGRADLATLKQSLSPLPDTADELRAIATTLGATDTDLLLARDATERRVKALSAQGQLAQYRVVAFATHGLVAGEAMGLAEPAIALSLPQAASDDDDGLLTASEAAQLKLDADWVVLSACNTAAGNTPGAEALSGLARAFFYAGARALLVSNWPVASPAAVKLTTRSFAAVDKEPTIGRAEALRRAMLSLIESGAPHEAHPAYWAPFVVVGEGAAAR